MREQLEPYRPANGTEAERFMSEYCYRCVNDRDDEPCQIVLSAFFFSITDEEYPRATWVYFNGRPTCLAFRDEDEGEEAPPPDPNQLDLFLMLPVLQDA